VNYSGDISYTAATATASITVVNPVFTISATTPASISAGQQATSTVTATTTTGWNGRINLSCALTSQPAGASNLPTCSFNGPAFYLYGGTQSAPGTGQSYVAVSTTGATFATNTPPAFRISGGLGGAALAALLFFIPARRRGWRNLLGVLVLLFVFAGLGACGGGSGGGGGGSARTTSGTYTFTVTAIGSPPVSAAPTATFTVTVN